MNQISRAPEHELSAAFIERIELARNALKAMDAAVVRVLDPQSDAFLPYGEAATLLGVLLDEMHDRLILGSWWDERKGTR